jgi:hypothetical protein
VSCATALERFYRTLRLEAQSTWHASLELMYDPLCLRVVQQGDAVPERPGKLVSKDGYGNVVSVGPGRNTAVVRFYWPSVSDRLAANLATQTPEVDMVYSI